MTVKTEKATPTGAAATTYRHAPTETIDTPERGSLTASSARTRACR